MKPIKKSFFKNTLCAVILCLIFNPLASYAQNETATFINPAKKRGYITWIGDPNHTYQIQVLQGTNTSNLQQISSVNTSNNYYKLDPLMFTIPNMYYQINVLDLNGNVIQVGNPVIAAPILPVGGGGEIDTLCKSRCNGSTYAWEMTAYKVVFNNQYGNTIVELYPTYDYINQTSGFVIPYYQAIDQSTWGQMVQSVHAYTQKINTSSNINLYSHMPFTASSSEPYHDKNGEDVYAGVLVEKQLDQYSAYSGGRTADVGANPVLCSNGSASSVVDWASYFNANLDPGFQLVANSHHPFDYIPEGVECDWDWGNVPEGGDGTDDWFNDIFEFMDDFEWNIRPDGGGITIHDWKDLLNYTQQLATFTATNGEHVTRVVYSSVLNTSNFISFNFNELTSNFELDKAAGRLDKGVYNFHMFSSNEHAIPGIVALNQNTEAPKMKDLSLLSLTPNPLLNERLVMNLNAKFSANATVVVYNLNGELLANKSLQLLEGNNSINISLTGTSHPYNQVRISVIFEDGSILQETGAIY